MARTEPTAPQQKFLDGIAAGLFPVQAARAAGYKAPDEEAKRLLKVPYLQPLLADIRATHEHEMHMTRAKVHRVITDAIEMARLQADPAVMIRGAEVIAKMCGYNAPEEKRIELTAPLRRIRGKFETLSDEELLLALPDHSSVVDAVYEDAGNMPEKEAA